MSGTAPERGVDRGEPDLVLADLVSPALYLGSERLLRLLPALDWRPASGANRWTTLQRPVWEERAAELGLPFVWPEVDRSRLPLAMRVASFAWEAGRAREFLVGATRLAYCGGFDLGDVETIAAAADAACLDAALCEQACGEVWRDAGLRAAARAAGAAGAGALPAVRVGGRLFCGERRIEAAADAWKRPASGRRRTPGAASPDPGAKPREAASQLAEKSIAR